MKVYYKVMLAVIVLVLAFLIYRWASGPGKYDSFAACLTEKGVSMGGTDWCPYCKQQKAMFGKSFKYVDYRNCDKEMEWCEEHNIKGYPTWVINGENYPGIRELWELAKLSGCEL